MKEVSSDSAAERVTLGDISLREMSQLGRTNAMRGSSCTQCPQRSQTYRDSPVGCQGLRWGACLMGAWPLGQEGTVPWGLCGWLSRGEDPLGALELHQKPAKMLHFIFGA